VKLKQDGTLPQLFGTQDEDIAVPNVVHTIILLNKNICCFILLA